MVSWLSGERVSRRPSAVAGALVVSIGALVGTGVGIGIDSGAAAGGAYAESRTAGFRSLRLLGEQRLPHKMRLGDTVVGGLSGFDRDPATGTWYFVSDDRWRYNPARFYTGRLDIDRMSGAFTAARLSGVTTLRRPDGGPYPEYGKPESADPESIRFDPRGRDLLWSSEGDRPDSSHPDLPLARQFIRRVDEAGRHVGELRLPANAMLTRGDHGPRRNAGIEALTFGPTTIAAAVEGPRYEDGEPPTLRRGAPTRVTIWTRDGRPRGQYVYPLDRLPAAPVPPTGFTDSGVSEILSIDDHRFLALERSWIEGVGYRVTLNEFDLRGATNVLSRDSLAIGPGYRPATKRRVADLSSVRPPAQNYEGLAWGPRLASGECTLVIGSDDNFSDQEVTRFLAFGARGC